MNKFVLQKMLDIFLSLVDESVSTCRLLALRIAQWCLYTRIFFSSLVSHPVVYQWVCFSVTTAYS